MTQDTTYTQSKTKTPRQDWMALLARADMATLESAWSAMPDKPDYSVLRAPETGMTMVRARAGGNGQRFNLGEMTITRCVVQSHGGELGHAYVAGRDKRHAMLAAVFDALLQSDDHHAAINTTLLEPTRKRLAEQHMHDAKKAAATRVDFFTMVRGDD